MHRPHGRRACRFFFSPPCTKGGAPGNGSAERRRWLHTARGQPIILPQPCRAHFPRRWILGVLGEEKRAQARLTRRAGAQPARWKTRPSACLALKTVFPLSTGSILYLLFITIPYSAPTCNENPNVPSLSPPFLSLLHCRPIPAPAYFCILLKRRPPQTKSGPVRGSLLWPDRLAFLFHASQSNSPSSPRTFSSRYTRKNACPMICPLASCSTSAARLSVELLRLSPRTKTQPSSTV